MAHIWRMVRNPQTLLGAALMGSTELRVPCRAAPCREENMFPLRGSPGVAWNCVNAFTALQIRGVANPSRAPARLPMCEMKAVVAMSLPLVFFSALFFLLPLFKLYFLILSPVAVVQSISSFAPAWAISAPLLRVLWSVFCILNTPARMRWRYLWLWVEQLVNLLSQWN